MGVGLRALASRHCEFECRRRHRCLSLVSVVCCQVEVSASGLSLVQRSPIGCDVSESDRETLATKRSWPTSGCRAIVIPWVMISNAPEGPAASTFNSTLKTEAEEPSWTAISSPTRPHGVTSQQTAVCILTSGITQAAAEPGTVPGYRKEGEK